VETDNKKDHALQIFLAAIDAVHPSNIIPEILQLNNDTLRVGEDVFELNQFENIYVAGAGKAAATMAFEAEKILKHHIKEGVVATRDEFDFTLRHVRAILAGHPLPDTNSVVAAEEITKLLKKIRKDDLLIFLLSGGASSLMMDVPYDCTLDEVNTIFRQLLHSGATINELNTVRKHLSELKGGQLVKKCSGATIVTLIISDVMGNDLQSIGSGPTVGDETTFSDALNVLEKYGLLKTAPYAIVTHLQKGAEGNIRENPKPADHIFANTRNLIIADNKKALNAAVRKANALGYETHVVTESLSGLAEEAAAEWVKEATASGRQKLCLLAGGETTVQVKGNGKGGRSQQFALAAAIALKNSSDITLLAAGTDGSDGPTDAAGAIIDEKTYRSEAESYLRNNDAYTFFEKYGGLVKTGATHTNVMDLVVTLI
jgi:hydroxypyruvate reductase